MGDSSFIFILALVTLLAVLAYGAWQFTRAHKAKADHETAAPGVTIGPPRDPGTGQPRQEMPIRR
jgi:hypothetical protein